MKKRAFTKIWPSGAAKTTRYEKLPSLEAVVQRCSIKKVFLEILQIHRKTPVPESLFNQVAGLRL